MVAESFGEDVEDLRRHASVLTSGLLGETIAKGRR
jgi:hypothetical protein